MINTEQVLPWHEVEASVVKEKKWLREVFDFSEFERGRDLQNLPISLDEMLRQISVSIVRGDIKVKELKSKQANSLWVDDVTNLEQFENDEYHGSEWHRKMMTIIKSHFIENGFEVVNEPYLNQGRSDLGVYKENYPNLFVEVGTTSLYKSWINLHTMPQSIFLFVPSEYYALEFQNSVAFAI
ncbi:TPA: hypothetical protein DEP58_03250 [Patescibacteria group bacterium]|nr:MAG: hypothetical protein UU98_C0028G0015 [Parcubacteria group bacterium GW2011_GWD2_42_14]HCC05296.1 hypothetical protein [Patescibacteria group bacterium]